ncbi:MAG TPA: DM9 repeat-containing protein [Polyangia bacterium]|nr:DM9 repeat-containing protein [Polyangia bacterium]
MVRAVHCQAAMNNGGRPRLGLSALWLLVCGAAGCGCEFHAPGQLRADGSVDSAPTDDGNVGGQTGDDGPGLGTGGLGGIPLIVGSGGFADSGAGSTSSIGNDGSAVDGGDAGSDGGLLPSDPRWLPAHMGGAIPVGAFPGGQEGATTFYVCRAAYNGGIQSGKAFPMGRCNFSWGGLELTADSYQVLVGALYTWQPETGPLTAVPPGAVPSGNDGAQTLYVCRATYMTGIHPGKLGYGHCYIGYGGKEVVLETFDLLMNMTEPPPPKLSDRSRWRAMASDSTAQSPPSQAFDDDPKTRWGSGHQQYGNEWFLLDLGAAFTINQVSLNEGAYAYDYPVRYALGVSLTFDDAQPVSSQSFQMLTSGSGAATVTTIPFAATRARYILIKQSGQSSGSWWSIADLTVSGP